MKKLILISIIALFISSCNTISFEESMPKNSNVLSEFPKEMIGNYIDENKDTLRVYETSFNYGTKDHTVFYMNKTLKKDSIELKKFNDYYVLNMISENNENIWGILLCKVEKNKIIVYSNSIDKKAEDLKISIDSLIKITQEITPLKIVKEEGNEQTKYIGNPSNDEFQKLIDDNYFIESIEFKRIK